MRKVAITILCIMSVSFSLFISSCGHVIGPATGDIDTLDLSSYECLEEAKDSLLRTNPWNEILCDTILNATYSNQTYNIISKSEAENIYEGVLEGSAYMVWMAVDSTMKTSVYNGLEDWETLSMKINNKSKEYKNVCDELEYPNSNLIKVMDIIREYRVVLQKSKATFRSEPTHLAPYNLSYEAMERNIKSNKYWDTYFCNNSEIKKNINEFPQRVSSAKGAYYKQLKDKIKSRAESENITKKQLRRAINRFNTFTSQYENELSYFFMKYPESDSQQESNKSFWK